MPLAPLTTAWAFLIGGCIGSFLNVVVYRVPAGKSLIYPGSHCPKCERPIRWYHNVPILGWIVLRGQCHDCRASISIRYPVIETLCAVLFFVVAWVEGPMGGTSLPARPIPVVGGEIFLPLSPAQLVGIVGYHLILLSTLLAMALIEFDGHQVTWHLALPAWLVGLLASGVWPHLHPVPAGFMTDGSLVGLLDGGIGLLVGLIAAMAGWLLIGIKRRAGFVIGCSCVGLFLGWHAAIVLTIVSLIALRMFRRIGRQRLPATVWLIVGSLVWIVKWKSMIDAWPWLPWLG